MSHAHADSPPGRPVGPPMDRCFAYGSLMCPDIMSRVSGLAVPGEPATLAGHARHPVAHEDYPGLVAAPCGRAEGVLYRGLDAAALARLDAFEGEMYERRALRVNLVGGEVVTAWCYVFRERYRDRLLPGDWRFDHFLAVGRARFLARYVGFNALPSE